MSHNRKSKLSQNSNGLESTKSSETRRQGNADNTASQPAAETVEETEVPSNRPSVDKYTPETYGEFSKIAHLTAAKLIESFERLNGEPSKKCSDCFMKTKV